MFIFENNIIMEIKIYCLYEPHTLKIRYIGRTKSKLIKRLAEHICKAKHFKKYTPTIKGSYKINWINSLLKKGIKPRIKLLTIIEGWNESHIFEKQLIQKHLIKHNLVNGDDRGPGKLSKNKNENTEINRIKKIKEFFSKEENKINFYNSVYVYNLDGSFYKKYMSVKFIEKELGIKSTIVSCLLHRFDNRNTAVNDRNGFYFSKNKYDSHPLGNFKRKDKKIIVEVNNEKLTFPTIKSFALRFNLSSWDIYNYRKKILTKRVNDLFTKIKILHSPV